MINKKNMFRIVDITLIAIFLALDVFLKSQYIVVGENLRIYANFIVKMILACLYPSKIMLIYAFMSDTLGVILANSGSYFVGYLISEMLACFLYSFFLYPKVNLKRIIMAKASVNILVNGLLNPLWTTFVVAASKGYLYYATKNLTKNLLLLPLEILIFYIIYKLIGSRIQKYRQTEN